MGLQSNCNGRASLSSRKYSKPLDDLKQVFSETKKETGPSLPRGKSRFKSRLRNDYSRTKVARMSRL